jgi:hypothetical protein
MKALSLMQPWASALFIRLRDGNRLKGIETRSWKLPERTKYPLRIAIQASSSFPKWARAFAETERTLGRIPSRLPFGAIIGFVTIMGMRMTEDLAPQITAIERLYGDYSPGRWGWMLSDAESLPDDKIIPCKGALGLWDWKPSQDLEFK